MSDDQPKDTTPSVDSRTLRRYSSNPDLNKFLQDFGEEPSFAPDRRHLEELHKKIGDHINNYQSKGGRPRVDADRRGERAKKIARSRTRIYRELRKILPEMVNSAHYDSVRRKHRDFEVFEIADKDQDIRRWVSNIEDRRRDLGALADELTARKFGCRPSTVQTYCRDHKPRKP